jgi:hypothetical protein
MKDKLLKQTFIKKYQPLYQESWEKTLVYKLCKHVFRFNKKPSLGWLIQHKRILQRNHDRSVVYGYKSI